jgi:hypothetical protein
MDAKATSFKLAWLANTGAILTVGVEVKLSLMAGTLSVPWASSTPLTVMGEDTPPVNVMLGATA